MAESKRSKEERRLHWEQVLASGRISGHEPSPEFLADVEAHINGTLTSEECRRRSLARALNREAAARDRCESGEQLMEWLRGL